MQNVGYYVYRADNAAGPFARLTRRFLAATAYTDSGVPPGSKIYMVRAIKTRRPPLAGPTTIPAKAFLPRSMVGAKACPWCGSMHPTPPPKKLAQWTAGFPSAVRTRPPTHSR